MFRAVFPARPTPEKRAAASLDAAATAPFMLPKLSEPRNVKSLS